ncbi:MAG: FtsH protease activity modulator HflK [Alphaproteobacteria bacterium]
MSWNDEGGNPWGSPPPNNNQRPSWQKKPGGKNTPPDLDDLLRQAREKMNKFFPGGGSSLRAIIAAAGVVAVIWLGSGFYRVEPDEQAVVLRFGKYIRNEPPGLRYHFPAPLETIEKVKVTTVNRSEIGVATKSMNRRGEEITDHSSDESQMLTGDENIVEINFMVFWQIKNASDFLFKLRNPQDTVKKAAESAMREIISRTPIQFALTEGGAKIEQSTLELLQSMLDNYNAGIQITQVQMQKVTPPREVLDAFLDVQRAQADRERLRNEAEAYRNDILPRARGEAVKLSEESLAYKEQIVNRAKGDAERFIQVYEAYAMAKDVTAQRLYLETMENVLQQSNKVFLDSTAKNLVPFLPLNNLSPANLGAAESTKSSSTK